MIKRGLILQSKYFVAVQKIISIAKIKCDNGGLKLK